MANGKNTPHLDKWMRTFKTVGNGVGRVAKGVLESAAPGITTSAQSIVDAGREAQSAYNTAKSKVKDQLSGINRTVAGKSAQSILNDAYNDIKNGTFSLNKINDSSYDSIDDFDSYIDNISVDASDPDSVAIGESKKNMALLGRTVAEGNAATIEGMQNMTATISNVQIKTSQASTSKIAAIILTGVNQLSGQLNGVNGRLDTINKNLVSILDFQRNNVAVTNQTALEYYANSSNMMREMGAVISEMHDFMEQQKSMTKKKSDSFGYDPYDMSSGFDFSNYKELVKHNFKNSPIGAGLGMASMLGTIGSMGSSFGMSPMDMVLSMVGSNLLPKNIRKSVERLDKTFTSSIDELLYRVGDMRYDSNWIKQAIGSILGKERKSYRGANLANFKKDSMSWNGVAQKTLVEVIPSYLARIESTLNKSSERFYDMGTGKFITRNNLENQYRKNYRSTVEFNMRDFTEELNKAFQKSNVSEETTKQIYDVINDITDKNISGKNKPNELNKVLYNTLKGNVSENDLRDLVMSYSENMADVKKALEEFNKNIEEGLDGSVYRNLFNEGQDYNRYRTKARLNSGTRYTKTGKSFDDLTEEERLREEANYSFEKKYKDFSDKVKDKFKKEKKPNFDKKMASHIDNFTNNMYDKIYGYDKSSSTYTQKSKGNPIKSKIGTPMFDDHQEANLKRTQAKVMNEPFDKALDETDPQLNADMALVDGLMKDAHGDNESSLRSLVLGLYSNFLKPLSAKFFGKNGLFGKISENKYVKKVKDFLFNEKDGIFGGVVSSYKDAVDYLKYSITGKGYTDRSGKKHADTDNSVFGHLTNGYDFVFTNTMKYFFGDDYKDNEKFQKYFSWMDIKGKRDKKRAEKEASEANNSEDSKKSSNVGNNSNVIKALPNKSLNTADINDKNVDTAFRRDVSNLTNKKSSNNNVLALPDKSSFATMEDAKNELAVISNDVKEVTPTVTNNLVEASEKASLYIVESANEVSTQLLGNKGDLEKIKRDSVESVSSKIKKNLPKTLTAGVVGAAIGSSTMMHGSGILGSLFLPGGPIAGAVAGIGISIISKSKAFQEFLFGKEGADGTKQGGLISNKTQNFVKKNMPLIVGASAVGALKGLVKSSVGGSGGFLLNTLLPGGPIGGAILGLGIGLMKNNTKFNKILFGEKAEDGKERSGGIFSKGYNTMSRIFEKSGNFIKGGLKGLGAGILTGATVGKLGILGAALTPGGPIGMGLAGLGLGIASQSKKFQELLFGTEEFDENGNLKGRAGNGLLTKVRNMLTVNVFEPLKDKIQEKTEDFAYYLKKSIVYPFRLAFGPILDSMKTIKTDISDAVHEAFNNIADTVGKALKGGIEHLFKPFTSLLKFAGNTAANALSAGLKMAVMPVSAPLKALSFLTRNARKKAKGEETKTIFTHLGDIYSQVSDTWKNEDQTKYKGFGGRINKFLTHGRDLIQGVDAAKLGYEEGLQDVGYNSGNWMNVAREKRADKVDLANLKKNRKQWKRIDEYRRQINKENGYADINYTAEENEKIRKKLYRMGIDKDWIASDDDLRLFFKNKTDWKDKFDPTKNNSVEALAKNGIKLKETNEQAEARRNTAEYQKMVLSKFDDIVKQFSAMGFKSGLNRKKKVNLASIKEIDKNLKSKGLTWDDIDIDPGEILNAKDLDDKSWNEFMKEKFSNGEVKNTKNIYSSNVKKMLNRENKLRESLNNANSEAMFREGNLNDQAFVNDAFDKAGFNNPFESMAKLIDWLDGNIKVTLEEKLKQDKDHNVKMEQLNQETADNTKATTILAASDEYEEGASTQAIQTSTGFKLTGKVRRMGDAIRGLFSKKEKDKKEEAKDEYLRGSTSLQDDGTLVYNSAVVEGLEKDEKSNKKGTVFDTVKSGVKGLLGSIFSWLAHPTTWKLVGGGLTIAGLYGGKIKEFFDPILAKIGDFLKEKGLPFLETAFTNISGFVSEKLPSIIETFTTNIVNNMTPIIKSTAKIVWTGIETAFKLMANKLSKAIFGKESFDMGKDSNTDGKTYDTYEEAVEANNGDTSNIHKNTDGTATILGDYTDIDAEGNAYNLTNSSLKSTLARESVQFVRSKTNRKMAKATIKCGAKIAGWVSGAIPVFKTGKTIIKGTKATISGMYNLGKGIAGSIKKHSENKAKDVTKAGIEEAAKDTIKEQGENIAEASIKEASENIAKEGAEVATDKAIVNSVEKTIKESSKEVASNIAEETIKSTAKETAETAVKNTAEAGVEGLAKEVAKKGVEKSAEDVIQSNAKKATKALIKDSAEAITESSGVKKSIKTFLEKAKSIITKVSNKLPDSVKPSKFKEFVNTIIKELSEKLSKSSNEVLKKIGEHIGKKSAEATGRTVADASVIVGIGFAVWDGVNGALNASYLFGVNDSDVTACMRVVSSVMEVLLGTGPGAWVDILLEIYGMLTGSNPKQWFARKMYTVFGGDSDYLNDSITRLELETKKYNEINGTNLTTDAYNEKKNSSNSILGRIKKGWTKTFNKDKYNEKYDFSKYEISDEELAAATSTNTATITPTSTSNTNVVTSDQTDLLWGPGPKVKTRAIGYGTLQSDSRWADYQLGSFPNGTTSTMKTGGCGPTALSMVANSFGSKASPLTIAKYAKDNGYIKDGGSTKGLFTTGAENLGLKPKTIRDTTLKTELETGNPVVLSGKSFNSNSVYTAAGHVIKAQGYNNGYVKVSDPMRGDSVVKLSTLTSGMTNGWSYTPDTVGYGPGYSNGIVYGSANVDLSTLSPVGNTTSLMDISNAYLAAQISGTRFSHSSDLTKYVENGYKTDSTGSYKWNTANMYDGMTVGDLKTLALYNPELLSDKKIPVFKAVYEKYVKTDKAKDSTVIKEKDIKKLINQENILSKMFDSASGAFGVVANIIAGFAKIGANLISSKITGEEYKSIFDEDESDDEANTSSNDTSSSASTSYTVNNTNIGSSVLAADSTSTATSGLPTAGFSSAMINMAKSSYTSDNSNTGSSTNKSSTKLSDAEKKNILSNYNGGLPVIGFSNLSSKSNNNKIKTGNIPKAKVTNGSAISIGGGSKDLVLGYGVDSNITDSLNSTTTDQTNIAGGTTDKLSSLMNDINAVAYAQSAKIMGQDYDEAKQDYYNSVQNSAGISETGENINFISTEDVAKNIKYVPEGYGKVHSYMGWQCITSPTSDQMKLKKAVENYDSQGFGKVGDRYAVAMKPYYGKVGDYLNITQTDGTQYKVALADIKGSENGSTGIAKYVHTDGSMVEFVVDKTSWYGTNKTVVGFHPEWNQNIAKIENVGNYWSNDSGDKPSYGLGKFDTSRAIGYGYSWIQIVQAVKQALAEKKLGYSQSRYTQLNVLGTTIPKVRTDCSGYVSACLNLYGSMNGINSSSGFCSMQSLKGFTKTAWMGWDALQPGDIISKNGHVEIFGKNENGQHYVFSCGSTSSINNPGMTTDSRTDYTVVWRPNENCSISQLNGGIVATDTNSAQYAAASSQPSAFSAIGNIFKSFADYVDNGISFGPGQSKSSSRTPAGWFTKTLNGNITSSYGRRSSVLGNEFHRGLDIASSKGTPIVSPIDGTLVSSGTDVAGYGNYAVIRTSDGNNHLFAHMNKPVGYGLGSSISKNDIIGEVGSTGKSTGDHLHYEIRRDGNKYSTINPMNYKYDKETSEKLNINKQNHSVGNGIGGGYRDLTSDEVRNKLDIALNTSNVETKLDSLIEVMKSWAERDSKASKVATQNNTNITTNNVSYGSGQTKKSTKTVSTKKDISSDGLLSIHKAIAAKA